MGLDGLDKRCADYYAGERTLPLLLNADLVSIQCRLWKFVYA